MKFHILIQIMKNQVMTKNLFFAKNFITTKTVNRGLSVSSVEGRLMNFVQEWNLRKHSPASFTENILFYKLIFILFYYFMYFILILDILFSD